jgi:short subunit dehydrogenase-like uncharacterized protein
MSQRDLDLVLFGATGYTGGLVADYLAGVAGTRPLRWALAGRNHGKLETVRARLAPASPELIVADAGDARALGAMAQRARVVITTVGPYGRYGEPLVRACAQEGTDYVDLTGEPEFVDAMRERYHALAEKERAKIVNAAGFDSIPHDLGAYFALRALRERMSESQRASAPITIEGFVQTRGEISGGTWQSTLDIMANARHRMRPQGLPQSNGRKASQLPPTIRFRSELGLWAVSAPLIDPEVIVRSAAILPEYGPDFHYGHYLAFKRVGAMAGFVAAMGGLFALTQLPPAKKLLQRVKNAGEGPSPEARAKGSFRVTFLARGAGHAVRCEVRGGDPGYGETSRILAEAALCLAFDRERLPQHYGVVPSAAALGTTLIDRLRAIGISFRQL